MKLRLNLVILWCVVGGFDAFVSLSVRYRVSALRAKQSIAVVGSGAVGSYYGARLWESGAYNVKFHMRGEHYETSVKKGLNVTSIDGDIFIPPESLNAYKHTDEMGTADWVVVALKSTSLDAIPDLISPLLHRDTRVLVIMNGLVEDDLVRAMNEAGADFYALYGGMALLCSNRLGPGRVDHSYAGFLSGGVATSQGTAESDRKAFESLWKPTKVEIGYEKSLLRGRWRKSLWNLPFNGISVAMGGITVDIIVNDPGLRRLADLVMDETIAAANADLSSRGAPSSLYLGDEDVSRSPGAQDAHQRCSQPNVVLSSTHTSETSYDGPFR